MFAIFKGKRQDLAAAEALYEQVVTQSRNPVFYDLYGVPDTIDGRFDLICLHVFLVMDRLFSEGRPGKKLSQNLFDVMFRDMDRSLREMGVGDLSLPKHVKRMMKGFNGRATAYQGGMTAEDPGELIGALLRNLYGTLEAPPEEMAHIMAVYMHESTAWLAQQPWDELAQGAIAFKEINYEQEEDGNEDERKYPAGMVA